MASQNSEMETTPSPQNGGYVSIPGSGDANEPQPSQDDGSMDNAATDNAPVENDDDSILMNLYLMNAPSEVDVVAAAWDEIADDYVNPAHIDDDSFEMDTLNAYLQKPAYYAAPKKNSSDANSSDQDEFTAFASVESNEDPTRDDIVKPSAEIHQKVLERWIKVIEQVMDFTARSIPILIAATTNATECEQLQGFANKLEYLKEAFVPFASKFERVGFLSYAEINTKDCIIDAIHKCMAKFMRYRAIFVRYDCSRRALEFMDTLREVDLGEM